MILIAAPKQAAVLKALTGANFDYQVLQSLALPAGTIVGVAPNGVAVSADAAPPTIETSTSAAHFEDSDPLAVIAADGTMAAPSKSLFQMGLIGIKIRCGLTWATITPGAVQMIQNVAW